MQFRFTSLERSRLRCAPKLLRLRAGALLALLLLAAVARDAHAQDANATESVYFPHARASFDLRVSAGLTLLTVPLDIAEEELNKAPALDLHAVLGLPLQFHVRGRAIVQYITNEFRFGGGWSHHIGPFGVGVEDESSYWFGSMPVDGFDTRATGWMNYPSVSIGIDAGGVLLTAKAEAILLLNLRSYVGENEVGSDKNVFGGGAFTFTMEQAFWKNTHVVLGARLALTQVHPQTWFAFSGVKRKLLYSELIFGVIL